MIRFHSSSSSFLFWKKKELNIFKKKRGNGMESNVFSLSLLAFFFIECCNWIKLLLEKRERGAHSLTKWAREYRHKKNKRKRWQRHENVRPFNPGIETIFDLLSTTKQKIGRAKVMSHVTQFASFWKESNFSFSFSSYVQLYDMKQITMCNLINDPLQWHHNH
jgi:hypothetical protein